MALYTTAAEAATRLARYAGLTVPSTASAPNSPMDLYIKEASQKMEEYLHYGWESVAGQTKRVLITRDGQGLLEGIHDLYNPLTAVTAVSVPTNAQYSGPSISASSLQWDRGGMINVAFPITYANPGYSNPVPFARDQSPESHWYKLYPDELLLTYTAGRSDTPPAIFESACIELIAVLIMGHEDPDSLVKDKVTVRQSAFETRDAFRDDPYIRVLRQLARYQL